MWTSKNQSKSNAPKSKKGQKTTKTMNVDSNDGRVAIELCLTTQAPDSTATASNGNMDVEVDAELEPETKRARTDAVVGNPDTNDATAVSTVPTLSTQDTPTVVDDNDDEQIPQPKYKILERVFAKDVETGLLYGAIIRKSLYGVHYQRQLMLVTVTSEKDVQDFFDQEPEPTWHYFIHYQGWNVKWDRWVPESWLFDPTESTERLAKRLGTEVSRIRSELRKAKKGSRGKVNEQKVAELFHKRAAELELEHRQEEKAKELAAQGIVVKAEEEAVDVAKKKSRPRGRWTKAGLEKELKLRSKQLQGRRKQVHSDMLVLPFTLKKLLVEDWEIITQCGMLPILPAKVTVKDALDRYVKTKMPPQTMEISNGDGDQDKDKDCNDSGCKDNSESSNEQTDTKESTPKEEEEEEKEEPERNEWQEMADGIMLLLDQAIPSRLLYPMEIVQYECQTENDQSDGAENTDQKDFWRRRGSAIYGCEYLLRLLVRLPTLLTQKYTEAFLRESILNKLNDLIRFLLNEQNSLFAQKYRKPTAEEAERIEDDDEEEDDDDEE